MYIFIMGILMFGLAYLTGFIAMQYDDTDHFAEVALSLLISALMIMLFMHCTFLWISS